MMISGFWGFATVAIASIAFAFYAYMKYRK